MKITPTCRYGHGELRQLTMPDSADGATHSWGLAGVFQYQLRPGSSTASRVLAGPMIIPSQNVYTMKAFRCTICGYMELFDDEGIDGGA